MKQGVVANESDPAGVEGAQGCEFNGVTDAYTDVMYFQADASFVYDAFHSTAEANGVQAVPGLGDRAFTYVGGNGPGVVVAKGDKLFTLEFSGIGSGPAERSSLLVLAQQAVGSRPLTTANALAHPRWAGRCAACGTSAARRGFAGQPQSDGR